jgi:hypothetical protein
MFVNDITLTNASTHAHMIARMYTPLMHARTHKSTYERMHVCTHASSHTCTNACMHANTCTNAHMKAHTCMHAHTRTHYQVVYDFTPV